MIKRLKSILTAAVLMCGTSVFAQNIYIDESFLDWNNIDPVFVDDLNDGQQNGIDFEEVWVHNDDQYIYFRFRLNREINLQDDNDLALYIDTDNNLQTGFRINGIGAELRYFFGGRFGFINEGQSSATIGHEDFNLTTLPTVTSDEFELVFDKRFSAEGVNFDAGTDFRFRIEDNSFNGDEVPNMLGGIDYSYKTDTRFQPRTFSFSKEADSYLRVCTYNIERDQLFEPGREDNFRRVLQTVNADIFAFQEVRDFSSAETKDVIESFLPGNWFHDKVGFDIVVVSKYPIVQDKFVAGNGAFIIDVDGKEICLVNAHLPCCDNNTDRQDEADRVMQFVRQIKNNELADFQIASGTPIIIVGDMNLVGDRDQQQTLITGDIKNNSFLGPDFSPDWDNTSLEDANPLMTNGPSTATWQSDFTSFSAGRLDYILYTGSVISLENAYSLNARLLTSQQLQDNNLFFNDVHGASDHFPVVADFRFRLVDTEETSINEIRVLQNPFGAELTFSTSEANNYRLVNINGQVVSSGRCLGEVAKTIPTDTLPAGSYFLLLVNDKGEMSSRKLVKI